MEIEPHKESSLSKMQIVVLAVTLVVISILIFGRQFGRFGAFRSEPVTIPSGAPYAEATVIGAYEGVVLAERVAAMNAQGNTLQKKMEILTDEKTVFAEMTPSGPMKISRAKISESDVIWVYNRIRSFEEVLKAPADPELAIPFEETLKNPRERIKADFVVRIGGE